MMEDNEIIERLEADSWKRLSSLDLDKDDIALIRKAVSYFDYHECITDFYIRKNNELRMVLR